MAVTIIKNFWNGTDYKSIAKIVFTSPNFTSPYQAGTRSHMQPGGKYMGTWYEAVDFMYRQRVDQDYVELPEEMESFFGKMTSDLAFDFSTDTSLTVKHMYGDSYDMFGDGVYPNVLYMNRDNYATIASANVTNSGVVGETVVDLTFDTVVGDEILNDWGFKTASGIVFIDLSAEAPLPGGEVTLSGTYTALNVASNDEFDSSLEGDIDVTVSGSVYSVYDDTISGTIISGTLFGDMTGFMEGVIPDGLNTPVSSNVSDSVTMEVRGWDYGTTFIANDYGTTLSGIADTVLSGTMPFVGDSWVTTLSGIATAYTSDARHVVLSGLVGGTLSGTVIDGPIPPGVSGTLLGEITGRLEGLYSGEAIYSNVSGTMAIPLTGFEDMDFISSDTWDVFGTIISQPASSVLDTSVSGTMAPIGDTMYLPVIGEVNTFTSDSRHASISGTVSGTLEGTVISGTVYPNVSGTLLGVVTGLLEGEYANEVIYSNVSGTMSVPLTGLEHVMFYSDASCVIEGPALSTLSGTVSGTVTGNLIKSSEFLFHQYSDTYINSNTTVPRPRRHHGENSILFSITFGEAYDCRLTAWDDDTHATTLNKVLIEEHYKVDAVAYRSNLEATAHTPSFQKTNNLVFPPVYDAILKGDELYYGDFDLIFAIEEDEYGEYLAFIPRLVDMDESFVAGSYDFVTTLHYQYT